MLALECREHGGWVQKMSQIHNAVAQIKLALICTGRISMQKISRTNPCPLYMIYSVLLCRVNIVNTTMQEAEIVQNMLQIPVYHIIM